MEGIRNMVNEAVINYWLCETGPYTGHPHDWLYRGKEAQRYLCRTCQISVTKAALREHTNA